MSKQINIRIPDDMVKSVESTLKDTTVTRFVTDAINLALTVEQNMGKGSRLVIENAKDQPGDYKLLLKSS